MKRVSVKYKLIFDDILRALQLDHRLYGRKKQKIQSIAFGVLSIGFLISYLMNREYKLGIILGLLCLGVIAVIWEMPFFSLKQMAKNIEKQNAVYTMDFQEDKVLIGYGAQHFEAAYTSKDFYAYEDEFQYLIYPEKKRMFCIPKRKLTKELRQNLREGLEQKLGERFQQVEEKKAPKKTGRAQPQLGAVKESRSRSK